MKMSTLECIVVYMSCMLLYYLIESMFYAIYVEDLNKVLNPRDSDFQIQMLSNGHVYMGCPADDKRLELLEEISQESSYERGYFAYWEGLESSEVSDIQFKGWLDARDEVEKSPAQEISSR